MTKMFAPGRDTINWPEYDNFLFISSIQPYITIINTNSPRFSL